MTELCRNLRSKSLQAFDAVDADTLAALYAHNEVPWSCRGSGRNAGPDDELCAPEACQPGRGCFQPSPRLIRKGAAPRQS